MPPIDLRYGPWQLALRDIDNVDLTLVDAPYSRKVHKGNDGLEIRDSLGYDFMDQTLIIEHVDYWAPRTRGWFCSVTSHDLVTVWTEALAQHGRYVFAPVPIVDRGMAVRLQGDGPSSWTCYLVVSRPRSIEFCRWGTTPGAYIREAGDRRSKRRGGKPLGVMRKIVSDYSRRGDLVLDTHAGGGTTLIAAAMEGRRSVGAEVDKEAYDSAMNAIRVYDESAVGSPVAVAP